MAIPNLPAPYRQDPPIFTNIPQEQRDKWRRKWAVMDCDGCTREHYKHYEWELRKCLDELEAREMQLRESA